MAKIDDLGNEYIEKFGKFPPEPINVNDSQLIAAMNEAIDKGRPIPDNYPWYADMPDGVVV
jgi:hypothetical protein